MKSLLLTLLGGVVLFYLSYSFGLMVKKKISFIKYSLPIGFFLLLGITQITLYYATSITYDGVVSTNILMYLIIVFLIIATISNIFNRKAFFKTKVDKKHLCILGIALFCTVICLIFFCEMNSIPTDNYFYIGHIKENALSNYMNAYNPFDAFRDHYVLTIYRFQTYYHFIAGIFRMLNYNPYLFCIWVIPLYLVVVNCLTIINIIDYLKVKNKIVSFLICIPFTFSWSFLQYSVNGNNFKIALFCYLYLFFIESAKTNKLFPKIILSLLVFAGLSLHSSFLFQAAAMLVVAALLIKKQYNHLDTVVLCGIPLLLYIVQFYEKVTVLHYEKYVALLLLIYLLIRKYKLIPIKGLVILLKSIIWGAVLLIWGYGVASLFGGNSPLLTYESFFIQWSEYNISTKLINGLIFLLIIYYFICTKMKNSYSKFFLYYILIFYNPISIAFVSTYLTSDVYFRLREPILQCPWALILLFSCISWTKLTTLLLSVLCLVKVGVDYPSIQIYQNPRDLLYRMPYDLVEIASQINYKLDYMDADFSMWRVRTISADTRLRLFTDECYYVYSFEDEREFQSSVEVYDNSLWNVITVMRHSEDLEEAVEMMEIATNVFYANLIIVDNKQSEIFYDKMDSICRVWAKNDSYRVYACYFD